ncbi:hypothetical protein M427DRAFT_120565 [Gonapodya prolifera JEL478]|uniref:RRM domain-containing protein n=1 Tax=Gonapodya prolifera (strain JEL478) TaxID=1344416 RepID=A0A139AQP4_GONPJ|nr:hypothetical protein M427DRAFT_120565 [Gonapodya prolifera JEL478]|eukprot:KXS19081.1 hypothetical protein M427DRAFT_120565 [Gonapodya prolifera JEL478]
MSAEVKAEVKVEEKVEEKHPQVFVGNLPFSTTNTELKDFFGDYNPTSAQVVFRGNRSLGYGFVTFAQDADAESAVKALDKKELGGREVNVEVAKLKDESAPAQAPAPRPRGRGRGGYSAPRPVNGTGEDTADPTAFHAPRGRGGSGRGGFRGRGRGRGGYHAEDAAPAPPAAESHEEPQDGGYRGGRGRGRGGRGRGAPRPTSSRPVGDVAAGSELSTTTLFVANVPFRFEDDDLKTAFAGYNIVSAHVVKMRSGRSKGFGFVEATSPEEQKKILAECTSLQADGRDLVVRAALASQVRKEGEEDGAPQAAAAATN